MKLDNTRSSYSEVLIWISTNNICFNTHTQFDLIWRYVAQIWYHMICLFAFVILWSRYEIFNPTILQPAFSFNNSFIKNHQICISIFSFINCIPIRTRCTCHIFSRRCLGGYQDLFDSSYLLIWTNWRFNLFSEIVMIGYSHVRMF